MEREWKITKGFQHKDSMRADSTQRKQSRTDSIAFERALTKTQLNVNIHVEVFDSHAYDAHTIPKTEQNRRDLRRHKTLIDLSTKIESFKEWSAPDHKERDSANRCRSISLPEDPDRLSLLRDLARDDILQSPSGIQEMRDAQMKVKDNESTGLDVIDLKSDEKSTNEKSDNKTRKKSTHKKISTFDNPLPPILETTKMIDDEMKPLPGSFERKRASVIATLELLKQQENEARGKLQLVKRIQSKARIRPKYKPYFSELGSTRSTRPPRKLAPIAAEHRATSKEVNHTVNSEKEPLLDNRFVSLIQSLTKM